MKPIKISQITAQKIIKNRYPEGLFYLKDNNVYVGIDNSNGDSFTEAFKDKKTCLAWLKNESITYFTETDFGKTLDELH